MIKKLPKWLFIICAVFLIMQYLICLNVYLMGDDYMYGTFGHEGVFSPVFSYYFTGNGRWLVNILDSLWLFFDRYLFVIVNPWLLLLLGILLYRFISALTDKQNYMILVVSLTTISVISILMTCEVFYWITGTMNYLVPALLLLASMTAVIKMRSGSINKKKQSLYSFVCIASCLTMEQYGLMAIGWMFLVWGWDVVESKQLKTSYIVTFIASVLGLASIVFAPANFARMDAAAAKGSSLLIKLIDLIYYDYYSATSSTLVFIIAAYCGYRYLRDGNHILSIISFVNAGILLFIFDYRLLQLSGGSSLLIALISILMTLITVIPGFIVKIKRTGIIYIVALLTVGIGSQLMLLKTEIWGFRTSFSWILLYIIILLTLISDKEEKKEFILLYCISCIAINPYMGIIGVIALIILQFNAKLVPLFAILAPLFVIVTALSDETIGYKNNSQVHRQNITAAEEADKYAKIMLQDYIDERYGWNSPPFSEFHENYFRNYYHIPDEIIIEYGE